MNGEAHVEPASAGRLAAIRFRGQADDTAVAVGRARRSLRSLPRPPLNGLIVSSTAHNRQSMRGSPDEFTGGSRLTHEFEGMLTADYVRCVYDYGYWARDRILAQVSQLDHGAYVADARLDYGSIRGTLVHILEREATWLARWEGRPDQRLGEQELPTFATLREAWSREETKMRAFLQGLSDPILLEIVEYESTLSRRRYAIPLWQMMAHLAHHGTQHRSEVALALTQRGHSPGDLDLIVYFDPRPR